MDKLFDGVVKFNKNDFEEHRELFEQLGRKQNPHTLFIGCADSRLIPNLITKTMPGELFVIRNVANIIPPHRKVTTFFGTTSAIEFAVQKLKVENIIVCGHSNCGGCNALFADDEYFKDIPSVKKWLELAKSVKNEVKKNVDINDVSRREWMTEQLNVIHQIKHLLTHPFIKKKYKKGELKIFGWYYIIETGEVFNYNFDKKTFELITK
jgi:carbonic anhydrase